MWALLARPPWHRRWRGHRTPPLQWRGSGRLPALECVWTLTYLAEFHVRGPHGPRTFWAALDACSGSYTMYHAEDAERPGPPPGPLLPPDIDAEIAWPRMQEWLFAALSRQRGGQRQALGMTAGARRTIAWPYYLYYFPGPRRTIDVRAADAVVGDRVGHQARAGLLNGLARLAETAGG